MSRRNTDAITIHSILDWIEDNLESPLSLEKVSERSGYSKWHLQRMFKKETGHSLGQYIRSRKMTEFAQKLKESNEPILYLAERYGFESQQTLTRTFKNYFDVPPHKYRMTNMQGESRFLHPLAQEVTTGCVVCSATPCAEKRISAAAIADESGFMIASVTLSRFQLAVVMI